MESSPTTNPSDEIDLLELLAKLVLFVKDKFFTLLLAFVIGTTIGTIFYFSFPKEYTSKMILESGILTESYCNRITESFDNLLREQNLTEICKRLNISEAEAQKINKIEIENLRAKSDNTENSTFLVTVRVKDNAIFAKLQNGIIFYLQNNEYVKIRVQLRKEFLTSMITKINREISSLDSLKKNIGTHNIGKGTDLLLMDPSRIHSSIVELYKQRLEYTNSLAIVNSIQLIEGFTLYNKPSFPKLSWSLAGGGSLGLIFLLFYLGYKSLEKIIQLSKEKVGRES